MLNEPLQGRVLNAGRKPFFVYLSISIYISLFVPFICFLLCWMSLCRVGFSTPDVSLYVFLSVSFPLCVSFYTNLYVVFLWFSLITLSKTLQGRFLNAGRKCFCLAFYFCLHFSLCSLYLFFIMLNEPLQGRVFNAGRKCFCLSFYFCLHFSLCSLYLFVYFMFFTYVYFLWVFSLFLSLFFFDCVELISAG